MLAIRSNLRLSGLDEAPYCAARTSAADAVVLVLAAPGDDAARDARRRLAAEQAPALAQAKRPVHLRASGARSGELDADLEATVGPAIAAIVLTGAEAPQDVRDADVAIRKREMRRGMPPGSIRLLPEVDSAAGLQALPAMLAAVDRHGGVVLNASALRADVGVFDGATAVIEHAMAVVALAARAAGLPWVLDATSADGRPSPVPPARAYEYGAAGVVVLREAEALGMNALFTPDAVEVASAREAIAEWVRLRERGRMSGIAAGRLVDRRTVRRARALVAMADAIAARERAR